MNKNYNIDYRTFVINKAVQDIRSYGFDARVCNLYNSVGDPSIVIVIPGVRLEDGELIEVKEEK